MNMQKNRLPSVGVTPYTQVRGMVQTTDLLFCSGSGLFSRAIQIGTKSVWSHVAMVTRIAEYDRVMVIESVESSGIRLFPLSSYVWNYGGDKKPYPGKVYVARYSLIELDGIKSRQLQKMGKFALDAMGTPYDKEEITRIAFRIAGMGDNVARRDKEYICSEFVYELLLRLGHGLEYNKKGIISPSDIANQDMDLIARIV